VRVRSCSSRCSQATVQAELTLAVFRPVTERLVADYGKPIRAKRPTCRTAPLRKRAWLPFRTSASSLGANGWARAGVDAELEDVRPVVVADRVEVPASGVHRGQLDLGCEDGFLVPDWAGQDGA